MPFSISWIWQVLWSGDWEWGSMVLLSGVKKWAGVCRIEMIQSSSLQRNLICQWKPRGSPPIWVIFVLLSLILSFAIFFASWEIFYSQFVYLGRQNKHRFPPFPCWLNSSAFQQFNISTCREISYVCQLINFAIKFKMYCNHWSLISIIMLHCITYISNIFRSLYNLLMNSTN